MFKAKSPPHLSTLVVLTAFATLSLNMFLPSLANIAHDLDSSYAVVSFAVAGYLAVTAIVQLIAGPFSDRFGRRPVLLAALALFCVASIACALAQDVWTFLMFRMLQGGVVAGYVLSLAIVRDISTERQSARLIGYISMAMALVPMLGPILGGVLDTVFGWRSSFYFYGISGFGLLLLCWADLGETRPDRQDAVNGKQETVVTLMQEPRFWGFGLCTAFSTGAFYVFLAGAPLVANATFGISTAELGVYLASITAGFMIGSFVAARLAMRHSLTTMMLAGRLAACLGPVIGAGFLAFGVFSPFVFFGSTALVGLGNGLTMPSSNAGAMAIRPGLAGSAAGLSGALTVAAGAVLTTFTGLVLTANNAPFVLLAIMFVSSFAGLLAVIWLICLQRGEERSAAAV